MSNKPQEDYQAIQRLVEDADFRALNDYVPPFSLLGVINRGRDELTHSRIIAAMFEPRSHQHAADALRVLLKHVSAGLKEDGYADLATKFDALREGDLGDVSAAREKERIDIVLEFGGDNSAVIGIENKIDASESHKQLTTYQKTIRRVYLDRAVVMVFLTRDGRPSRTCAESHPVPCIPLSYQVIREAADAAAARTELSGQDPTALKELSRHIEEEIMGDVDIKNKATDIWKEHRHALKTLLRYRPTLKDIRKEYEARLKELRNEDDTEITYYPTRGTPDEIKLKLRSWTKRGVPFVFMLHTTTHGDAKGRPRLRLLITKKNYKSNEDTLRDLAGTINSDSETAIELDENFEPLPGWSKWHRVLKEEALYPDSAVLGEVVIPGETEEAAITQIKDWIRELEPYVEELPSRE